ncbi:nucleoside hydrolase [Corynebacterium sp. 153RC1]|uniref:nucleoside hydrolase n=1 Tax=unclassified Corynebacterium TaxID=2624378 RepID=UPI00211B7A6E|nr:nucleoside hydrolase [Corynebacterium sp. 209RC1]MCQ9353963.1 nucleoside hydrolase [Corynebacterium sp. 1222RC1]MCQ9355877.1 nucleoside hydrolase [Corynebacterium sp. 122RC1]MCQ9358121.1 nucleoside hydrolase [Corynebacterium sp. 142RC1]MCQ9360275.1 nucleoside hydrolase [Corynebacterium sp. 153RC1]MCQ9362405.1 nucleoside hydrolase [Corynebacterium sp. 732RC1]MCQ9364895.1 nucleoside hydrolase [Corynebacterium sp. 70RC1]MCQ9371021.1 nucleoside hydrolase [Corynebacterium sp. 35RC1]
MQATTKIILDLDTGIDDALALAYALGSPELELIGVTATYGNVLVETGVRNDLALLELFGASDVPVFAGEPHALAKDNFEVLEISEFIHGRNGIGEVEVPDAQRAVEAQSAVDFLIESVRTYGDELIIVPTGAMTNIAAAMQRSPEFAQHARIVFMGGALTVPGNVSPWAEANINQDPEAADFMVRNGADVTMIGLDVTLQTLLTTAETQQWRALGTKAGEFLADATDYYIRAYETTAPHLGGCGLHDPLAVGVAVDPTLVRLLPMHLKVDTEGATRGRTIGNEEKIGAPNPNARVAVAVDTQRFLTEFMERVGRVARGFDTQA